MITKTLIAVAASLLVIGFTGFPAEAQDQKAEEPKGIKVKGLVTSLGGFSATVSTPIFITGATVELEPGGQTGRQEFRVPTYIYVIEGVLTTEYEAGPIGWHNLANRSNKPVKYLMLHVGYPGRPDPIQKPDKE